MKTATQIVDFYVNKDNMKEILRGKIITNFEEMHNNLFKSLSKRDYFYPIYEPRKPRIEPYETEYPTIYDRIIGKVVRYIQADGDKYKYPALEIEWGDALYIAKIPDPCIKLNGYFYDTDDGNLEVTEITRLTLSSRLDKFR